MYASIVGYLISFVIDRKSYYERMKERLLKALPERSEAQEQTASAKPLAAE